MTFNWVNVAYKKYVRSIRKLCCALIEGVCTFAGKLSSIERKILQSGAAIENLPGQILDLYQSIDKETILRVDKVVLLKLQLARWVEKEQCFYRFDILYGVVIHLPFE